MAFTDNDRADIAGAITTAEAQTSGEIVCVVAERADRYAATGLTVATLLAFAVPLAMVVLGFSPDRITALRDWSSNDPASDLRQSIEVYAALQALIFVVAAGLLVRTRLGAVLTPRSLKRARVHAEALSQFRARGIGATRARTGVLIFVSLPDRIAEVVADAGIYAKVAPEHWGTTVDALIDGIKAGSPAKGFVAAIGLAGAVLAEHFPCETDNPDELPNRLIEI